MLRRIFFCLSLLVCGCVGFAQQLILGTYNLRYKNNTDSGNLWTERAPYVAALIRYHDFDVLGTQEAVDVQLSDLVTALPQYARVGVGRDDGKKGGEHAAILYKKDKFNLLKAGDFWLSPTPDTPTMGWDAKCCKRLCSWVYLEEKSTHNRFYFFNAHFDHEGMIARRESSKLILEKIRTIAGTAPVVFTGDLNGGRETEWYKAIAASGILSDSYLQADHPYANNGSFNGFGTTLKDSAVIDHIFISKQFRAEKWAILTDTYRGKFPSDHFPVICIVNLKPGRK